MFVRRGARSSEWSREDRDVVEKMSESWRGPMFLRSGRGGSFSPHGGRPPDRMTSTDVLVTAIVRSI